MANYSRGSVFHSLIWKFMERCTVQIVTFIVTIVLARILCPEEYGIIALVMVFINLASVIVEGGLNTALIQKKEADQLDFSTIFHTSIGVSFLLYCILFFSAPAISRFYNNEALTPVVRVLALTLFFYAINSVQKAFLIRNLLFKKLFYSSFGAIVASGSIGIFLALKGYGVWALVAQNFIMQLATTAIMWATVKWRPTLEFSMDRFKGLFNFGWKIFTTNMMINVCLNVRSLIIGKMFSASSLALFDRGRQLPSLIIDNINSSIQSVLFPVLSNVQDEPEKVKSMVRRSIKTSAFIISPLVFGMAIVAKPLIICLMTEKWIGTVPFIQIFCCAYLLMPLQIANLEAIKALGHSGTTLKLEAFKKLIEISLLVITIPIGIEAIAWSIVIYNIICLVINAFPNKKLLNYGLFEQFMDVIPSFILSAAMGVVIMLLTLIPMPMPLLLISQISVGAIAYIGFNMVCHNEAYCYIKDLITPKLKRNKL